MLPCKRLIWCARPKFGLNVDYTVGTYQHRNTKMHTQTYMHTHLAVHTNTIHIVCVYTVHSCTYSVRYCVRKSVLAGPNMHKSVHVFNGPIL